MLGGILGQSLHISKRTRVLAAKMDQRAVLELLHIPWVLGSTKTFQSDLTVDKQASVAGKLVVLSTDTKKIMRGF